MEDLYQRELEMGRDLNGDGVIGAPSESAPAESGDKKEEDKPMENPEASKK